MPPRLSVIVTCYNLERYIGEAIESVLSQDCGERPEIIVVDDCSTDRSAEVIRSFEQVRYVRMDENSGVLLAMLAGIEAASGELLFFLDGDDVWEPGKLSAVVECFDSDPAIGLVTHDFTYIDASGAPLDRVTRPEQEMRALPAELRGEKVREGTFTIGDFFWFGSAFAIRRSLAELDRFAAWARSLPDPRNTYQDWPLAYWVASLPQVRFGDLPAKLFRYRLHDLNHSGDARTAARAVRNFRRTLNTLLAMKDIATRRGLPERYRRLLDQRAAFYVYLVDLNSGRRMAAAKGLLGSLAYLRGRRLLAKELARFAAIQLVGPERFARYSSRRSMLRNLPAS